MFDGPPVTGFQKVSYDNIPFDAEFDEKLSKS